MSDALLLVAAGFGLVVGYIVGWTRGYDAVEECDCAACQEDA